MTARIRSSSALKPSPAGEGTVTISPPRRVARDSYTYRMEGNSPSTITIRFLGGRKERAENATAEAMVTLGSIETLPGGADKSGAISSARFADMADQESAQARTPRRAQVCAYSASAAAAARGIAPRELLIKYVGCSRIGNSGRNRSRGSEEDSGDRVIGSSGHRVIAEGRTRRPAL